MRNNTIFISNINIISKQEYSLDKQAIRLKSILRILYITFSKIFRKFVVYYTKYALYYDQEQILF
ncbi:MAG: hypothetical protein BWX95_02284 [Bacteroidetes bacterium ADurb.Bin141]|nr:MAG: hypothetical protein BWX95_02284 [Bacteroidetes bacterium ADurb.Bin141]